MNIHRVTEERFKRYGTVVQGYDFSEILEEMKKRPIPEQVEYMASDPALEALRIFEEFSKGFYGGMPTELGYCMGHNAKLNALEYHRGSEVNVSVTDYIVLIGSIQDMEEHFYYGTGNVEAFYVPEGLAVEFYATTLHYCACHVSDAGYCHATFLPKGTNCPLESDFTPRTEEDTLLTAKNKWILVHRDGGFDDGRPAKLYGENLTIGPTEWGVVNKWKIR